MPRFYITTAIDYVNSRPHLGTAYEKVTADVIARYKRLAGFDTRFLMGNDEHSQNVYQRAREQELEPLAFCDRMETAFRDVWQRLDISFDDFIRTTEERHRVGVTALVSRLIESGDVYEGFYEGWYCVSCEAFKQEKDLVDGACPVHQRPPQWIREKNHFFRLSKYREPLLERYAAHPEALEPEIRRNEILRLLEAGLEDISMSRTGQSWGIPVPSDPGSVVYVWMDALINYVSGVGYGADDDLFDTWWPADLHVIGKDITRFHCVVWPAMLMSAGVALPRQVFGHGWVHWQGQKMSKSLGTAVDPLEAVERLGPDPLRLYLTKEIAYGQDGDFTWERFEDRYNVDLANNFGNLVSRIVAMAHRYRQGRLVAPAAPPGPLAEAASSAVAGYRQAMDRFALHQGVAAAFRIVDAANEYIASVEPWVVARDPARAAELDRQLYDVSEAVRLAAVLLAPVMPRSCAEVLARIGAAAPADALRLERDGVWQAPPGAERRLSKGPPLWPRIETGQAAASGAARTARKAQGARKEQGAMNAADAAPPQEQAPEQPEQPEQQEQAPERPRISIDQFAQMELRVGRVAAAEAVPKSRKLLRLEVDDGTGVRQIVAGLAKSHPPESLVGRSVVFIANLKPAKLAGLESNGMVLAASGADGTPVLLTVDRPDQAPPGSTIS